MFAYEFVRHALLAILLITPLFGLLGTMIVNNKMAFFSDALGHSAITGIAIGVILGMSDTTISMVVFGIVFALLLNWIKYRGKAGAETIISVFASCGLAIGLAVLSAGGNFARYNSLLIGDILSITHRELCGLLLVFVLTLLFWFFCFNRLHFVSINPSLAQSKGISVRFYDNLFVVLMAVIVMLSIRWVGQKSGQKYENLSFVFRMYRFVLRCVGTDSFLLYRYCHRTDDCPSGIGCFLSYFSEKTITGKV